MNEQWAAACDGLDILPLERAASRAVFWITDAIDGPDDPDRQTASVETAGAYVRAWRASRPGDPADLRPTDQFHGFTGDRLLWAALGEVQRAAVHSNVQIIAMHLDAAEEALRIWWEQQEKEKNCE